MNKAFCKYGLVLVLLTGFVQPEAEAGKIGVVDIDAVVEQSELMQKGEKILADALTTLKAERMALSETIKQEREALVSKRKEMSLEAFGKQNNALEAQEQEAELTFQQKLQGLELERQSLQWRINRDIEKQSAAVAKEEGYSTVLSKWQVIFYDEADDLTEKVLLKHNQSDITLPK